MKVLKSSSEKKVAPNFGRSKTAIHPLSQKWLTTNHTDPIQYDWQELGEWFIIVSTYISQGLTKSQSRHPELLYLQKKITLTKYK